ncbi:multiple sugar transport system substrate-binding protein [Streptosporangium subroseum]|uniref:Multiple sugar transport system substrate-binding protein n=1 Tax=Streptosporangium subroseum TaxID=106412 RepID=A0A239P1D3_9ACTN|nr:extracellular solute-binding protein [Streptosporangium subroseum]SNT60906.1 multiple sugar transport system substrate-binding protein [Streptosporangium subroseum]
MTAARKRTRILAVAVTLAVGLTAAACGGSGDEKAGTPAAGQTLKMWTFKRSHADALNKAAAQFKSETGIAVTIEAVTPDDVFVSKVQGAAQTNGLPDVLELHAGGEDLEMGASGLLSDLSADVNDAWKQRLLPTTRETGVMTQQRIDIVANDSPFKQVKPGTRFSVPFTAGAFGIVYANKEKLKAAGLSADTPPKTWEEFLDALKATTAKDPQQGGLSLGLKTSQTGFNWVYQPMAHSYLGKEKFQALFAKGAAQGFGSPDGVKSLELYSRLTPYWMPGTTTLGIDEADIAFAQGKSAFDVGGTFTLAFLAQNGLSPDKVLTFPIPPPAEGQNKEISMSPLALTSLGITSTTKNREAALKWLDWVTSPKGAGVVAKSSLDLPATDLGAEAESLLGADLAALQKYFTGAPESAYDAADVTFFPSDYDQVKPGDVMVRLTPLKEATPEQTGTEMDKVMGAMWKSTQ